MGKTLKVTGRSEVSGLFITLMTVWTNTTNQDTDWGDASGNHTTIHRAGSPLGLLLVLTYAESVTDTAGPGGASWTVSATQNNEWTDEVNTTTGWGTGTSSNTTWTDS